MEMIDGGHYDHPSAQYVALVEYLKGAVIYPVKPEPFTFAFTSALTVSFITASLRKLTALI